MDEGQEVVIVDAHGTEHVFPPGFNPMHAAAIVRNGGSSALPTKPVSAEDFVPQGDLGQFAGYKRIGDAVIGAGKAALDHPVQSLATVGALAAVPLTGGASLLPAAAAAGLGAAGGAGLGSIVNAARGGDNGPTTAGGVARTMATEGALGAAGEGIGRGVTAGLKAGATRIYRGVLRPSVPLQREFADIAETGLREGIPVSAKGAQTADSKIGDLSQQVKDALAAKDAERQVVRGYLPPAREAVPLGAAPTPGQMPTRVVGAQRLPLRRPPMSPSGSGRYAEYIEGVDPVESMYASGLDETGHRVPTSLESPELAGPGVVYREMQSAPGRGAHGSMIAPDEIARRGLGSVRSELSDRALSGDANDALSTLEQRFLSQRKAPLTLQEAQRLKQAEQGLADTAYKAEASGGPVNGIDARFHQGVARGAREAIEQRVPSVGPLNAQTQSLIGLRNAIENANMRNVGIGVKGLIADTTPGLMSGGAIAAHKAAPAAPSFLRALMAALGYQPDQQ
jgi:hypothetical protein